MEMVYILIAYPVVIVLLVYWRTVLRALGLPVHQYRYRNRFNRKCVSCDQHEMMYHTISGAEWEEMHPGHTGHQCSSRRAVDKHAAW